MRPTDGKHPVHVSIKTILGILLLFVFISSPVLADKPDAGKPHGKSGPSLEVTLIGTPHWVTTYGWTINKSVDSDVLEMMEGASGTSFYTIVVAKDGGTEAAWIDGEVCVANVGDGPTEGLAIAADLTEVHPRHPGDGGDKRDEVQAKDRLAHGQNPHKEMVATIPVDVSSEPVVEPKQKACYDYRINIPTGGEDNPQPLANGTYKVTAHVNITNHLGHPDEKSGPGPCEIQPSPSKTLNDHDSASVRDSREESGDCGDGQFDENVDNQDETISVSSSSKSPNDHDSSAQGSRGESGDGRDGKGDEKVKSQDKTVSVTFPSRFLIVHDSATVTDTNGESWNLQDDSYLSYSRDFDCSTDHQDNTVSITYPDDDTAGPSDSTWVTIICHADGGTHLIQDPVAEPRYLDINTPTTVTITAKVNPVHELLPDTVHVQRLDENYQVLEDLGQLFDDQTYGDALPGDSIFTGEFTFSEPAEGKIRLRVTASYSSPVSQVTSYVFTLDVLSPMDEETAAAILETHKDCYETFLELKQQYSEDQARLLTIEHAKGMSNVRNAGLSVDGTTIWILYSDGMEGVIPTGPEGTQDSSTMVKEPKPMPVPTGPEGTQGSSTIVQEPNPMTLAAVSMTGTCPDSNSAIIYSPFYTSITPNDISDGLYQKLRQTCTKPHWVIMNGGADVESFRSMGQYGLVVITSHGGVDMLQQVFISTGEEVAMANMMRYSNDLITGKLSITISDGKLVFAIPPDFITTYVRSFPKSLIYLSACHSLDNPTMANAFLRKGAVAYAGYKGTVYTYWTKSIGDQFFGHLIDDRMMAREAFTIIPDKQRPDGGEFIMTPYNNQFMLSTELVTNGKFETGNTAGWTAGFEGTPPGGYAVVLGGNVKEGRYALRLGRWDQVYTGGLYGPPAPGTEPFGYDYIYQDVVVPSSGSPTLRFSYNVQTYDTAIWDWFDVNIKNPASGSNLATVVSHDGKPGSDYGTYWNGGWKTVSYDLSPWRGQTVRIWFGNRQDGFGDQNAVFIDDVSIPCT